MGEPIQSTWLNFGIDYNYSRYYNVVPPPGFSFNESIVNGSIKIGNATCGPVGTLRYLSVMTGANYIFTPAECGTPECGMLIGTPENHICYRNQSAACLNGEYPEPKTKFCFNCSPNCAQCVDYDHCTACSDGLYLYNASCGTSCPFKYYADVLNHSCEGKI